jgi:hypothetical protein
MYHKTDMQYVCSLIVLSTADGTEIQHIASDPRCDVDDVEFDDDEETVEAVRFDYDRYVMSLQFGMLTMYVLDVCMHVIPLNYHLEETVEAVRFDYDRNIVLVQFGLEKAC